MTITPVEWAPKKPSGNVVSAQCSFGASQQGLAALAQKGFLPSFSCLGFLCILRLCFLLLWGRDRGWSGVLCCTVL